LNKPDQNVVINLLGVKLEDRPWFFLSLFSRIREMRARTGRPHWLIVDEAHHAIPASWRPTDQNLPERLEGVVMVSVTPNLIAPSVLRALDTLIVLGDKPREMLREFTDANRVPAVAEVPEALESGTALLWSKTANSPPALVRVEPSRTEPRRHLRKYAEGELPEDRSFYFRGRAGKLNLRAQNLIQFMDLGDGVDDETWLFHLQRGEMSRWLREGIKDEPLAAQAAAIERNRQLDAGASRRKLRELIEATYTLPAQRAARAPAARLAADASRMAARRSAPGAALYRRRDGSARLWRQQQAARRREPCRLLQACNGARPGRSDAPARVRALRRGRARPRRPRRLPHGARPCASRHATGAARYRADAYGLNAGQQESRDLVFPLVLPDPARAAAGDA